MSFGVFFGFFSKEREMFSGRKRKFEKKLSAVMKDLLCNLSRFFLPAENNPERSWIAKLFNENVIINNIPSVQPLEDLVRGRTLLYQDGSLIEVELFNADTQNGIFTPSGDDFERCYYFVTDEIIYVDIDTFLRRSQHLEYLIIYHAARKSSKHLKSQNKFFEYQFCLDFVRRIKGRDFMLERAEALSLIFNLLEDDLEVEYQGYALEREMYYQTKEVYFIALSIFKQNYPSENSELSQSFARVITSLIVKGLDPKKYLSLDIERLCYRNLITSSYTFIQLIIFLLDKREMFFRYHEERSKGQISVPIYTLNFQSDSITINLPT